MKKKVILAIDQGTTGTTAAYFDEKTLNLIAVAKQEFRQIFPQPGWVEHDANDIWQSTKDAITLIQKEAPEVHISAIGITNQRETVVAWNRLTGEVAGPAIVWQDRRTADMCAELQAQEGVASRIYKKTGLVLDPYFSATKMNWILQNNTKAQQWCETQELAFGTMDCYIMYRLTAGKSFVTEHTNASRTMLYNLHTGAFDEELCSIFKIPLHTLPKVQESSSLFGACSGVSLIPDGTPILGCLGDQQAALYGHNCTKSGEAKITFGTGAFLLMSTGSQCVLPENSGLLSTVAYSGNGQRTFALEGAAFIAGAAVQYLRDKFEWFTNSAESESLALKEERDPEVVFVPAFAGLGAPYWNPHARATLLGLTRGTSKSQITRAVIESIALQNAQLLELMQKYSGTPLQSVSVDGKAALNNLLMQFQADALQISIRRPKNIDTTALGAAKAALVQLNLKPESDRNEDIKIFQPQIKKEEAKKIVSRWQRAADMVNTFYTSMI